MRFSLLVLMVTALSVINGCSKELSFEENVKLAEQLSREGKTERAIEAYKKASQIKPENSEVHDVLGRLYYEHLVAVSRQGATNAKEAEEYKKTLNDITKLATAEFKKALALDPSKWFARYMVATDFYNNKRYEEAIKEYAEVIKTNPNYSTAYGMLGESYLALGNYVLAKDIFDKEYQLDHNQERYLCSLGKAYYIAKDYNKGFEMLTRLKNMKSPYYDDLVDFKFTHNIP